MNGAQKFILLGCEHLDAGKAEEALQLLQEALKILPSSEEAHLFIAEAYFKLNHIKESAHHAKQAFSLHTFEPVICERLITLLRNLNAVDMALELCRSFLSKNEDNTHIQKQAQEIQEIVEKSSKPQASSSILNTQHDKEAPIKWRFELINYCIHTFGYKKYLEIGCHDNYNFSRIKCDYKVGVDPVQGGTLRMKSDKYFSLSQDIFDIIFIDGLHLCEQVVLDIHNALEHISDHGLIIVHDCMPLKKEHQERKPIDYVWNGDVWKAFVEYRQNPELEAAVASFDHGVGVIIKNRNHNPLELQKPYQKLTWEEYTLNRQAWLNIKDENQVKTWLDEVVANRK